MVFNKIFKNIVLLTLFTPSVQASDEILDLIACHVSPLGWTAKSGEDSFVREEAGPFGSQIKIMYIDGMPRGWAFTYKDGMLVKKDFYNEYGQLDKSQTCLFSDVDNRAFTLTGNGMIKPQMALENGKPYKGFIENQNNKIYYKNGMAHGQALINSFNQKLLADITEKGVFYEGYKNGVFEVKWVPIVDENQYVRLEYTYDMGKQTDVKIVYAWPELVRDNLLLQKLDK